MRSVNFAEFRRNASALMHAVERGEEFVVLRRGRPIARLTPPTDKEPSWKSPALRLPNKGASLSSAIVEERKRETLS